MVAQNIVAVPYAAPRPGEAAAMDSDTSSRIVAKDGRSPEIYGLARRPLRFRETHLARAIACREGVPENMRFTSKAFCG